MIAGLFVGGASLRMGGRPKGLLPAPDGSGAIAARLVRVCEAAGLRPVLVGRSAETERLLPGLERIADRPAGIGPIGGVAGLLAAAGAGGVVTLACDMPAVDEAMLRRLLATSSEVPLLAPRDEAGRWQPFFARWDAARALPWLEAAIARGERSMQRLFDRHATALPLDAAAWRRLRDWDTPEDVAAG